MCHGKAGVGTAIAPNLHGAFGAKAGAANAPRNFAALKASKLTWNAANLDAYLAAPAKLVPGTNMPVAVANPKDRSEEHTSELQSLMRISYAVFCLKKKTEITLYTAYRHEQHERSIDKTKSETREL